MSAHPLPQECNMRRVPIPVARFRAPDGDQHTVALLATDDGWQIVDQNGPATEVVETLRDPRDEREQAEAIARDYAGWAAIPAWARQ
jgi:hypothetical protein